MRSAVERCETFLALEAFQDQYTDVWIFDRVANFRLRFFSDRPHSTFRAIHRTVASDICI